MDEVHDLTNKAEELASTEKALRADTGTPEVRIRLLELTLADSVHLTYLLAKHLTELYNKDG